MKVIDVMSKNLIICSYDINVVNLSNIMKKYNIGFIPIEKNKKIIGIVTDRDIVVDMISNKINYSSKIEAYINKKAISVDCNSTIEECLEIMAKNKIKRLIVTDSNKLVGIVSMSDILNSIYYDKIIEAMKTIWAKTKTSDTYKTEIDEFYL
ncbi:MAG: CBS domain-containing protein [Clostridium sp.]|nr:CBS domain-containing protein [Clostridium sp.]MCM1444300.1 CBS domain-containing protein [Candidatus Amulumruptor caecigallinarius]